MCVRVMVLVASILAAASCALSGPRVPDRIATAATEHDCTPLGADPEARGEIEPWFVSLSPYTGSEGDFAFLCRTGEFGQRMLLVIDVASAPSPWSTCSSSIRLTTQFDPQGLVLVDPAAGVSFAQIPLEHWRGWRGGGHGPPGVLPSGPIIDTGQGIAGWAYYCHEGVWLALFVH